MNILLLAPQPFFIVRGSPIAIDLVLKVLSERADQVDVVTYHIGQDIVYDNVTIHRTVNIPFIRSIQAGFSWKKLVCDLPLFLKSLYLAASKRHHIVHAVEESVFFALIFKWLFKIPYMYDMDSSLAQQMVEQFPRLSFIYRVLEAFEKLAVRHAKAVVVVCDSLAAHVARYEPEKIFVLQDIALVDDGRERNCSDLRTELGLDGLLLMYVGNLQPYQGIDLLLESTQLVFKIVSRANLIIIGGTPSKIKKYEEISKKLGIEKRVHFLGSKSLTDLGYYLSQADIVISPRVKGQNTPMKIYSYLASGKPILATNLPTHTQVLDETVALLVEPTPQAFADGELQLLQDEALRVRLGAAGKQLAGNEYSFNAYRRRCNHLYDWLEMELDLVGNRDQSVATAKPKYACVDEGRSIACYMPGEDTSDPSKRL